MTGLPHPAASTDSERALAGAAEALRQLEPRRPGLDPATERASWHAMGRLSFRLLCAAAPVALPDSAQRHMLGPSGRWTD